MSIKLHFYPQIFREHLLKWYANNARDLPWRHTTDPYAIWLSEVMLQQTQVKTVISYYEKFLEQYPTPFDMAAAPLEEVLKQWEGLGYYSRARNLYKGVQSVVKDHGGIVPQDPKTIKSLSGIGSYTAGAILSIAYGLPEPAVDGNVMRVLTRIFTISEDITKAKTKTQLEELLRQILSSEQAGDFTQAMMELGALICKPKNPQCSQCPVIDFCKAKKENTIAKFPVKKKKKPPKHMPVAVGLIHSQNQFLICQRQETGIFHKLWCFPFIEYSELPENTLKEYLKSRLALDIVPENMIGTVKHTLTHRQMEMAVFWCNLKQPLEVKNGHWIHLDQETPYSIPIAHQKIINFLNNQPLILSINRA